MISKTKKKTQSGAAQTPPPIKTSGAKLNVASVIDLIREGKTAKAIQTLKEHQCSSSEGCGSVVFQDGLCFNHYHIRLKYGRDNRVNIKHKGEMCSVCNKRRATNRNLCLPCYARKKYHEDKEAGILDKKKESKKKGKK